MTESDKPSPDKAETKPQADPGKAVTSGDAGNKADRKPAPGKSETGKKPAGQKPTGKPAANNPGRLGTVLGTLALLATLAVAAGGYTLWQQQQGMQGKLDDRLARLGEQLDSRLASQQQQLESRREQFATRLQQQMKTLQNQQQEIAQSLTELINKSHYLREDWLLAEAEYLVNLAGQRLSLMGDVKTAITALESADARLRDTGNPAMIALRKALAEDIAQLRGIDLPDITGLSLQLGAIARQVDELRLVSPTPESVPHLNRETSKTVKVENWRELPAAMWDDVKKLIVIRDHRGPVKPLLSPEQHFFLVQNLKLQLEQARLALLDGRQDLFDERLQAARAWIDNWFDAEDPLTGKLKSEIDALMAVNIHPRLPELRHSFQAFEKFRQAQRLEQKIREQKTPPAEDTPDSKPGAGA